MDNKFLEKKKMEAELKRVESARFDLEVRVLEREDEIKRIKDHILVQENKEKEIKQKLEAF